MANLISKIKVGTNEYFIKDLGSLYTTGVSDTKLTVSAGAMTYRKMYIYARSDDGYALQIINGTITHSTGYANSGGVLFSYTNMCTLTGETVIGPKNVYVNVANGESTGVTSHFYGVQYFNNSTASGNSIETTCGINFIRNNSATGATRLNVVIIYTHHSRTAAY